MPIIATLISRKSPLGMHFDCLNSDTSVVILLRVQLSFFLYLNFTSLVIWSSENFNNPENLFYGFFISY